MPFPSGGVGCLGAQPPAWPPSRLAAVSHLAGVHGDEACPGHSLHGAAPRPDPASGDPGGGGPLLPPP